MLFRSHPIQYFGSRLLTIALHVGAAEIWSKWATVEAIRRLAPHVEDDDAVLMIKYMKAFLTSVCHASPPPWHTILPPHNCGPTTPSSPPPHQSLTCCTCAASVWGLHSPSGFCCRCRSSKGRRSRREEGPLSLLIWGTICVLKVMLKKISWWRKEWSWAANGCVVPLPNNLQVYGESSSSSRKCACVVGRTTHIPRCYIQSCPRTSIARMTSKPPSAPSRPTSITCRGRRTRPGASQGCDR